MQLVLKFLFNFLAALYFFFFQNWGLNSGPYACKMLYHLNYAPAYFALVIFQIQSVFFCFCFCPGLALDCDPPSYTSQIAGIIEACHHSQLIS
jgi:hypothetical protein